MAKARAPHWRARSGRARDLPPALRRGHCAAADHRGGSRRARALRRARRGRRPRARGPRTRARPRHLLPAGRVGVAFRLLSLAVMLVAWFVGAQLAGPRMLPDPYSVALMVVSEAQSGALAFNLGATLLRVAVAFIL